jgi:ABC-type lipoprotein release transport system permease subunit
VLFKLAWRNIWRNKRRTVISVLALALGVTAIVSLYSVRELAYAEMIRGITKGLVGNVQVHGRGYQDSPEMNTVVPDPLAVEARLKGALPGAQTERRVIGAGLASSGDASTAVVVMGIEPCTAGAQTAFTLQKGRTLGASPAHAALIGTALANELGLAPGGELVLVGQAADGSLANDRFTVVGIADTGSSEANATTVLLQLADAQSFFGLGESVHQVIVRLPTEEEDLSRPVSLLRGALDLSALEVLPWTEILPELKTAMDDKRKNQGLISAIVFLIVALGILNTMTMATFERTREFGVLASLGTRRRRILAMVVLEALLQGLIGFGAGLALAWALLHAIGTANFSGLTGGSDVLGAPMPGVLRLVIDPGSVISAGVTTVLTMLAGGLLPAIRASRLRPVEATRYV